MTSAKQNGNTGEEIAARFLGSNGYEILDRNYRIRGGEIDIIAEKNGCLVFVEVKLRTTSYVDYGFASVNDTKRRRIVRAAKMYMLENDLDWDSGIRFDVIDIFENEITHYKGAFGEDGIF